MTREELQKMLDEHKKWLKGKGGRCAVLRGVDLIATVLSLADLRHADLSATDLSYAVLRHTDLRGTVLNRTVLSHADMSGANLDYSCWPLWCGSLNAHIDTRIAVQLLYHLMRPCLVSEGVDDEFKKALFTPELIELANKFHRVEECGKIEWPKEETK